LREQFSGLEQPNKVLTLKITESEKGWKVSPLLREAGEEMKEGRPGGCVRRRGDP
jgi:hypothetical protein